MKGGKSSSAHLTSIQHTTLQTNERQHLALSRGFVLILELHGRCLVDFSIAARKGYVRVIAGWSNKTNYSLHRSVHISAYCPSLDPLSL